MDVDAIMKIFPMRREKKMGENDVECMHIKRNICWMRDEKEGD
jgi:hypothetical protein